MKFLHHRKIQLVVLFIIVLIVGSTSKICSQLNDKPHQQYSRYFDMSTGSAVYVVEKFLKAYFLTMYDLDPEQRSKPEVPFVSKHNLAPFVEFELLESLHSQPGRRPKGEAISKAIGRFIGEHVASRVAQNVGAWNSKAGSRLVFVSGSLLGGYIGGEVGSMAYDVYNGYESLYNYLFHGEGEKSIRDKEL